MEGSWIIAMVLALALQVSSLALKRDETDENILSQRNLDGLADALNMLTKELRRADHPFGFGIGHNGYPGKKRSFRPLMSTHAFHGKRDEASQDDQNTSIFHGKRDLIEENKGEDFPSSTSAFHGKRDMREFIKMVLSNLEKERVRKDAQMK